MKIRTILVDDEILAMQFFELECSGIQDIQIDAKFESPIEALQYAENHPVDLAILDIEMPQMNGIEVGRELKKIHPDIILIYISAHDEYAMEAYNLHAPVYLEKPYNEEDVRYALDMARMIQKKRKKTVYIRTFGYFDVYVNGQVVHFSNKKAKELLAYLVDQRGSSVTNAQAINILWEDSTNENKYKSKFRRVTKDLRDTLRSVNAEEILVEYPNSRAVNQDIFDCDYYFWLENHKDDGVEFTGRYMSEYSWAEETLGFLTWREQ